MGQNTFPSFSEGLKGVVAKAPGPNVLLLFIVVFISTKECIQASFGAYCMRSAIYNVTLSQ